MKPKNPFALLTGWLALVLSPAHVVAAPDDASGAPTASITGRVQNVATGQYLNNARVSIKGTEQETFTDQFGTYQLSRVRSGPVVIEAFYTGLDPVEIPLTLTAGAAVEQNIQLTSAARYGQNASVVKLDPFLVQSGRETDAAAIATNEQRFAANIKNVISTDAFGPQMVGGGGEFLKAIPGIIVDYDSVDARAISLRGIGGEMTSFMADGAEMVNATLNAASRTFQARSLILADMARIEVTKVPLPSKPADSLGGSINFIRKNAFEKDGAEFTFGVALVGNNRTLTLGRESRVHVPTGKKAHRVLPGVEFSYTQPIGKNFGFVLSGSHVDKYNRQYQSRNTWNSVGTGIATSVTNPYTQNYFYLDGDRQTTNDLVALRADWRIGPHSTLSFGGSYVAYLVNIGNQQMIADVGTVGTPNATPGTAMTFGPTSSLGATARGTVSANWIGFIQESPLTTGNINYRFDDGTWRLEAGVNGSDSTWYRTVGNFPDKSFSQIAAGLTVPARVSITQIDPESGPPQIQAFDNNNNPINLLDSNSYRINTAQDLPQHNIMNSRGAFADLRRQIESAPFPLALQVGGSWRVRISDNRQKTAVYTFNGPDGNPATTADQGAAPYQIATRDNGYGYKNLPFFSPTATFNAWQSNPQLFTQTAAQRVAAEVTRLTTSEYINEDVYAGYVQGEARLFKNRMRVVTGVRFEETSGRGEGSLFDPNAVWVRNPNGSFARNAAGARLRKPEAGAAGSMEELLLTRKERAAYSSKKYHGYYPSLNFTFDLTENFLVRLAYARTYGRPDFVNIIPRTVVTEADLTEGQLTDPNISRGTLSVRNPSLNPWTADNYDLSLEYYSDTGGMFSASFFQKDIVNFFGTATRRATAEDLEEIGLEPIYVGWDLTTTFNSGDARIRGMEFSARHSLARFGGWGKHFIVFANATKLLLDGNPGANFATFLPKSANWGFTFNYSRLSLTSRWNYRGLDKRTPVAGFGPDGYLYYGGRTVNDLSVTYQMTRRLSLVGTWNNVFSKQIAWYRYGADTPDYARQWQQQQFGSMLSIGLNGKF